MNQLEGKIAIVTGVSRLKGIGATICEELAENDYHIFSPTGWNMIEKCLGVLI